MEAKAIPCCLSSFLRATRRFDTESPEIRLTVRSKEMRNDAEMHHGRTPYTQQPALKLQQAIRSNNLIVILHIARKSIRYKLHTHDKLPALSNVGMLLESSALETVLLLGFPRARGSSTAVEMSRQPFRRDDSHDGFRICIPLQYSCCYYSTSQDIQPVYPLPPGPPSALACCLSIGISAGCLHCMLVPDAASS